MEKLLEELEAQLSQVRTDVVKFEGGNKSAATRARVGAMDMVKSLRTLRQNIQAAR